MADPLDALMQSHGATVSAGAPPPSDDLDALMKAHGAQPTADFHTETKASEMPWDMILDVAARQSGLPIPPEVSRAVLGAGKRAGQTIVQLGHLANTMPIVGHILRATNEYLFGLTPEQQRTAFNAAHQKLEPTGTAEKIGAGAEQIGEVLIPAGGIEKLGVSAATKAAPYLARVLPRAAAAVAPKMAIEAASSAALAKVQGGDATTGAVLGAAVPAVVQTVKSGINAIPEPLREAAAKQVMQALGPTKERFKAIAERLTPEILKRGLRGSRDNLVEQAEHALESAGDQLDAALVKYGANPVSVQPVIDALETAKNAFRTSKTMSVAEALQKGHISLKNGAVAQAANVRLLPNNMVDVSIELESRALRQLDGLQKLITDVGPTSTVAQLRSIRQAWDKVVAQAGGYAHRAGGAIGVPLKDQSEAFAKREGASAIRELLAAEVPDLAAINKEYAFWKNLEDVVSQTVKRTDPQKPSLLAKAAEVGGAAAAASHGVGAAAFTAKVSGFAHRAFNSPRWNLMSADYKNQLADAIAGGDLSRTLALLARVTAVEGSKAAPATSGR